MFIYIEEYGVGDGSDKYEYGYVYGDDVEDFFLIMVDFILWIFFLVDREIS